MARDARDPGVDAREARQTRRCAWRRANDGKQLAPARVTGRMEPRTLRLAPDSACQVAIAVFESHQLARMKPCARGGSDEGAWRLPDSSGAIPDRLGVLKEAGT